MSLARILSLLRYLDKRSKHDHNLKDSAVIIAENYVREWVFFNVIKYVEELHYPEQIICLLCENLFMFLCSQLHFFALDLSNSHELFIHFTWVQLLKIIQESKDIHGDSAFLRFWIMKSDIIYIYRCCSLLIFLWMIPKLYFLEHRIAIYMPELNIDIYSMAYTIVESKRNDDCEMPGFCFS